MQTVWVSLTEWRRAQQRLDDETVGSPAWQRAAEDVDRAHAAYLAEVARVTARLSDVDTAADRDWSSPVPAAAYRSAG